MRRREFLARSAPGGRLLGAGSAWLIVKTILGAYTPRTSRHRSSIPTGLRPFSLDDGRLSARAVNNPAGESWHFLHAKCASAIHRRCSAAAIMT
jgi:hypothetical protein